MDELGYTWNGVDTNFVWRGTDKWGLRGLRVNGGTTTGRAVRDLCFARSTARTSRQHDGPRAQCNPHTRWETNVRGTAAYTILADKPWADILVSTVFQWRPGVERSREPRLYQGRGHVGAGQRLPRDTAVPSRRHGRSGGVFRRRGPTRTRPRARRSICSTPASCTARATRSST